MLITPKYKLRLSWTNLYQKLKDKSEIQLSVPRIKSRLPFLCLNKLYDWSRKLAPSSPPIRSKAKHHSRLGNVRFPALSSDWLFYFEIPLAPFRNFSLFSSFIEITRPILWSCISDIQLKSALTKLAKTNTLNNIRNIFLRLFPRLRIMCTK